MTPVTRFQVHLVRNAVEQKLMDPDYLRWHEWNWALLDTAEQIDGFPKIIHIDGGEPEDNNLVRDWAWICPLLNKLVEAKDGKES